MRLTDRYLVVDIETVPLAASLNMNYPAADRFPPANYKSDEAIAKWRATDRNKWEADLAKTCSLNPRLGRVLCVGTSAGSYLMPDEADEKKLLELFWEHVVRAEQIVTWNGAWDLRFIVIRSLFHGISPMVPQATVREWFRKYQTEAHFDCKAVLLNWDVRIAGEGLDEWSKFLGVPGKLGGISAADVFPLYEGGQYAEILEYCEQDVAATKAIYERIRHYF
jgi:hypothetical protein